MVESRFRYMSIHSNIPSTCLGIPSIPKMPGKTLSIFLLLLPQSTNYKAQRSLQKPPNFSASLLPYPTIHILGSSHSQLLAEHCKRESTEGALSQLWVFTFCHFFLEYFPLLLTCGRTPVYPGLILVSSSKCSLPPQVWLRALPHTPTTHWTLKTLYCSVSGHLWVSFGR